MFKKGSIISLIEKEQSESNTRFYDRANFIICNKNSYILDKLIKLSLIYSNIKYLKSEYDGELMNKIDIMSNNLYKTEPVNAKAFFGTTTEIVE